MNIKSKMNGVFNWQYFCQNIKKSKGLIVIMSLALIVLNILSMVNKAGNPEFVVVYTLEMMSHVNLVGLYVYPIVLSAILFDFLFDKKAIDFTCALPISRKNIFWSNTIGGVMIIASTMLVNTIVTGITIQSIGGGKVFFQLLIDNFVMWTIYYILFFVLSNFVFSLVGNKVSGIVTIAILILFVPFMFSGQRLVRDMNDYETEPLTMIGEDKFQAEVDEVREVSPLNIIMYDGNTEYYVFSYKHLAISVVGIIIFVAAGYYFFKKKRMEDCGVSFKNIHVHYVVKALGVIPFFVLALMYVSNDEIFVALIMGVVAVCYYLVYDFITIKSLAKVKWSIVYFLVALGVAVGYWFVLPVFDENMKKNITFNLSEVEAIGLECDDTENVFFYEDKEFIELLLNKESNFINNEDEWERNCELMKLELILMVDGYEINGYNIYLSRNEHEDIREYIYKNKIHEELYSSIVKDVSAINIHDQGLKNISAKEFIKGLNDTSNVFDVIPREFINSEDESDDYSEQFDEMNKYINAGITYTDFMEKKIQLCQYTNHRVNTIYINPDATEYVADFCAKMSNKETKKILINSAKMEIDNLAINEIGLTDGEQQLLKSLAMDYPVEFENYINEHVDDEVNVNKNILSIAFKASNNKVIFDGVFVTSEKQEFADFIEEIFMKNYAESYREKLVDDYNGLISKIKTGYSINQEGGVNDEFSIDP